MNTMKKLFAMALAVMMIMALAAPVAADGTAPQNATYTITIEKGSANRTYVAYQIFTGIVSGNDMLNVEWGKSVTEAGRNDLFELFAATGHTQDDVNVQDVARAVKTEADAKRLAAFLNTDGMTYLGEPAGTFEYDEDDKTYVLTGLDAGYYLIVDNTEVEGEHDAVSAYMMRLVKNVQIKTKDSIPTLEKSVSDINNSIQGSVDSHKSSADCDIGDKVPFHIHINLGDNLSEYETNGYKMVITDTLGKGLTFDEGTVKVVYGMHTLSPSSYKVSAVTPNEDGTSTFTITIENLFQVKDAAQNPIVIHSGASITIDYTATLNENANTGVAGNVNTASLTFSNNPTVKDEFGETEKDTAIVFTYALVVDKVDQDTKPLAGAAFKLSKRDINGAWNVVEEFTAGDNTHFVFKGLDDGRYRLEETAHPNGYNAIEPMEFDIVATHSEELESLGANVVSGAIELASVKNNEGILTGELATTVVNEQGATLPSTGGIGTTIFYAVGGILVFGAIILLVTKKRMGT